MGNASVIGLIFLVLLLGCTSPAENPGNVTNLTELKPGGNLSNNTRISIDCNLIANNTPERDSCLANGTISRRDARGCTDIKSLDVRDGCFSSIANLTRKISLCDNVTDFSSRMGCFAGFPEGAGRSYDCFMLPVAKRDACFLEAALHTGEPSHCLNMMERGNIDPCMSGLGKSAKNSTICERVIAQDLRDECLLHAGLAYNDTASCAKIRGDSAARCFNEIAHTKADVSICGLISARYNLRNICVDEISRIRNDPALCLRIDANSSIRDECHFYFAKSRKNPTYCNKIVMPATRDSCLTYSAVISGNYTICANITTSSLAIDNCLYDVGTSLKNFTACTLIEDLMIRRSCSAVLAADNRIN